MGFRSLEPLCRTDWSTPSWPRFGRQKSFKSLKKFGKFGVLGGLQLLAGGFLLLQVLLRMYVVVIGGGRDHCFVDGGNFFSLAFFNSDASTVLATRLSGYNASCTCSLVASAG